MMATEEHIALANFLKEVHSNLRKASIIQGEKQAWQTHCQDKALLKRYAMFMEKLATKHWNENCVSETCLATSRLKWVNDYCYNYFFNKDYLQQWQKEKVIANKIGFTLEGESHSEPIKLMDVGSCYNPFKSFEYFNVTAIDLCPANDSVLQCDFLNVLIGNSTICSEGKVNQLQELFYDVVTFCFLLEYIPTSMLRIKACENAYRILKAGGLLIIITPDSKHVGANSKIMKCWQYTLAKMGFMRTKYEKLKHMHCMAFRKAICRDAAVRWTLLHHQPYMEYSLQIPQDCNNGHDELQHPPSIKIRNVPEDFEELPFSNIDK